MNYGNLTLKRSGKVYNLDDGRPFGLDLEMTLISTETPTLGGLVDPESGYDFGQTPSPFQPGQQVAPALEGLNILRMRLGTLINKLWTC